MAAAHNVRDADDWADRVREYAARGEPEAGYVKTAKLQAKLLNGSDAYWEAVYTLARQNAQMSAGAKAVGEG
jgi:hypothetical protein